MDSEVHMDYEGELNLLRYLEEECWIFLEDHLSLQPFLLDVHALKVQMCSLYLK